MSQRFKKCKTFIVCCCLYIHYLNALGSCFTTTFTFEVSGRPGILLLIGLQTFAKWETNAFNLKTVCKFNMP